jgi:hypothetical protein
VRCLVLPFLFLLPHEETLGPESWGVGEGEPGVYSI